MGAHGTGAGPRCLKGGYVQVSSAGSIRTYQHSNTCLYIPTTHDNVGSLCIWLIALFQVEMMQLIPLGHVAHIMLGVVSGMSGMSEMCPGCPVSNWTFWTCQSVILSDPVR